LEGQGHKKTATLSIKGDFEGEYQLKWDDKPLAKGWREPREIAEYGGIAIAFFLTLELTAYQIIEQSIIGTGFDYWLGFKENHPNYNPDNFLNARLEISGINKGTESDVSKRVRQKIKQIRISDYLEIPGIVIVTEFSQPIAKIIVQ